jgi:membrane AbrB-like protein
MTDTLLVLAVGALGGLLGGAVRMPGGSMLGAMTAVGVLQLTSVTRFEVAPQWAILGQILVGAVIGSTLDRHMIASFRSVLVPGAFAVASTLLAGILIGSIFAILGFADPLTSLFGLAPGGMAEMTAAAIALGASGPLVASMHVLRVVAVIVLLPMFLRPAARRALKRQAGDQAPAGGRDD